MEKIKKVLKERSTWAVGLPSIIVGAMTILDADHGQEVARAVSTAGEAFVNTGDWKQGIGWLLAGLLGIFMTGRR